MYRIMEEYSGGKMQFNLGETASFLFHIDAIWQIPFLSGLELSLVRQSKAKKNGK
jgi:hypothetical protein